MGETKALFPREAPISALVNSLRSPLGDLRVEIRERTGLHASMAIWPLAAAIQKGPAPSRQAPYAGPGPVLQETSRNAQKSNPLAQESGRLRRLQLASVFAVSRNTVQWTSLALLPPGILLRFAAENTDIRCDAM